MLDKIVRGLCYASLAVPVMLVPGFFFPFVTTRAVLFRSCVAIGLALVLLKAQLNRMVWEPKRDPVFLALLFFLVALALSAAFGVSPWRSFYGDYERMGGVWAWLNLVGFYLLLRTVMTGEHFWRRFLNVAVSIGALVGALGIAERFKDALHMSWWFGEPGTPVLTTVGNGGIAAAYLMTVIAFALYLAMTTPRIVSRLAYLGSILLVFATILFTGNRSSVMGMMAGAIVAAAFYLLATRGGPRAGVTSGRTATTWRRGAAVLLAGSAAAAITLFAGSRLLPASYVERLPMTVKRVVLTAPGGGDASRFLQWKASWDGFRARPLLGYGPENYHVVWGEHMDPEIYRHDAASRWDRAHNAYLEALATSGIAGGLALLSLLLAVLYTLVRANRTGAMSPESCALFAGLFSAYGFYLIFWFFDLNSVMLIIAAAAYLSSRVAGGPVMVAAERTPLALRSKLLLAAATIALAGTLYVHGYETLRGAVLISRLGEGKVEEKEALRDFRAIFNSPAPLSYHSLLVYSQYIRALNPRFAEIRADSVRRAELDETFTQSFRIVDREARRDPRNERIAVHKARIAMLAAQYYGEPKFFGVAIETLKEAVAMSPRRIQTRHILANSYLAAGRPESAIMELDSALRVFPGFAPTHLYLGLAYRTTGDYHEAARWLHHALDRRGLEPPRLFREVAGGLVEHGESAGAVALIRHYLAVKYGPMWLWQPTMLREMPSDDVRSLILLAALDKGAGVDGPGRAMNAAIRTMCPPVAASGRRQSFDVCGRSSSLIASDARASRFRTGGIAPAAGSRPSVSSLKSESST